MSIVTQKNRSWWALVAFCTTTALVAAFSLAILIASASVAFAVGRSAQDSQNPSNNEKKSFSGVVTDSHCGARHQDSSKSPAECTKMCVRNGSAYVLVDGDKTYALSGDGSQFGSFAGQRVSVAGTLDGDTLRVDSIRAQQ